MLRAPSRRQRKEPEKRLNLIPILDSVFIFIFFLLMSANFIKIFEKHIKNAKLNDEKHLSPFSLKVTALLMNYEDAANEQDGIERVRQLGRFITTKGHIAFLDRYRDEEGNLPNLSK